MPNILVTNVRSIIDEIDELECVMANNDVDFAGFTESWLMDNIPTETIRISGYACYYRDDGRRGGGIVCYVRSGLSCQVLDQLHEPSVESLWLLYRGIRMLRRVSHIAIGIIYHAPSADSSRTLKHIISCLDYISRIHPSAGFVLLGDFNRLNDSSIMCYPLKKVVKCATRKTAILDKISDHNCVLLMSANRYPYYDRSDYFVNVRSNDTNGKILFCNALQNYNWSTFYRIEKCEDMLNYLNNVVLCLLDYHLFTSATSAINRELMIISAV
jgi:hypothetical protein